MSEFFYYRYTFVYFQDSSIEIAVWNWAFHQVKHVVVYDGALSTWKLLKLMVGWIWGFIFLENSTSWASLRGPGLRSVFQF